MYKKIVPILIAFILLETKTYGNMGGSPYFKEKEIVLSFTGDCILGTDLSYGKHNSFLEMAENQNYNYFFSNVADIFGEDDYTIVNLENPFTNSNNKKEKQFAFKGKPEFVNILKEGNIDIVNLANNHTLDYGIEGFNDTKKVLDENSIEYFKDNDIVIKEKDGVKIGFLGFTGWSNGQYIKDNVKQSIKNLKDKTDIIIITFHWGIERENYPNSIQKDLGRFAIDCGADLVIGHHPHVIQGIEIYKEKPIVYSLGNFCFGGNRNPADQDTFIFREKFIFDNENKLISQKSEIIPCSISSVDYRNDYRPTPTEGNESQRIKDRLIKYSENLMGELVIE